MVQDFIFDGQALSDFGYLMIYENSEDVIDVSNMQYETIKAALSDEAHRVAHTYESNYTSTFFIMKNPCVYLDEDLNLTSDDIRELTRWLARKQYKWFRFIDEEDNDETWYKAQIVVQKEFYGGNCIGLQLTVNANAPYGFSREIKHEISSDTFDINVQSDEEGYIYPDMTIEVETSGDVVLTNDYDGRQTIIRNCQASEIITIQGGDTQQISSNIDHDFTNDFNYVFPRLCNQYGNNKNHFEYNGSQSGTITNEDTLNTGETYESISRRGFSFYNVSINLNHANGRLDLFIPPSGGTGTYEYYENDVLVSEGDVNDGSNTLVSFAAGQEVTIYNYYFSNNSNTFTIERLTDSYPNESWNIEEEMHYSVGLGFDTTLSYRGIRKVGFDG